MYILFAGKSLVIGSLAAETKVDLASKDEIGATQAKFLNNTATVNPDGLVG